MLCAAYAAQLIVLRGGVVCFGGMTRINSGFEWHRPVFNEETTTVRYTYYESRMSYVDKTSRLIVMSTVIIGS